MLHFKLSSFFIGCPFRTVVTQGPSASVQLCSVLFVQKLWSHKVRVLLSYSVLFFLYINYGHTRCGCLCATLFCSFCLDTMVTQGAGASKLLCSVILYINYGHTRCGCLCATLFCSFCIEIMVTQGAGASKLLCSVILYINYGHTRCGCLCANLFFSFCIEIMVTQGAGASKLLYSVAVFTHAHTHTFAYMHHTHTHIHRVGQNRISPFKYRIYRMYIPY